MCLWQPAFVFLKACVSALKRPLNNLFKLFAADGQSLPAAKEISPKFSFVLRRSCISGSFRAFCAIFSSLKAGEVDQQSVANAVINSAGDFTDESIFCTRARSAEDICGSSVCSKVAADALSEPERYEAMA